MLSALAATFAGLTSLIGIRPARSQTDETVRVAALSQVIYRMFPHESVGAEHYRNAADYVLLSVRGDSQAFSLIRDGLVALDEGTGTRFESASADRQVAELAAISGGAFFRTVRARAIESLYRNPVVWTVLGYEGSSIEYGGYIHRGFDDIDWLPASTDPR